MAFYTIRCNLSVTKYPFASEFWGRSIIIHQQDQNYDTAAINAPGVVIDKGIPQAYYMHNTVPTEQGYQSVGYEDLVPPVPGATDFNDVYQIQTASGSRFLFSPAGGKNYIYKANTGAWASTSPLPVGDVDSNVLVTTAFVHGETYIFYANYGCFIYDDIGDVLVATTLTSLTIANIVAITNANNYMIAFSVNAIAWSSILDPTDFTPSLLTGAGGGSVNEADGNILFGLQISGGFNIYCQYNAVFAKYSGNINFPFITKEISGSGGVSSLDHISWQTNLPEHYAWTSAGLQQVGTAAAAEVYSEISDFIAAKIFEDFDETSLLLSSEYLGFQLYLSVKVISERFIIFSYGKNFGTFTHAIFYDLTLKRYGKLKINHVSCFEWNFPNLAGLVTYGKLAGTTYGQLSQTTYGQLGVNIDPPKTFKQSISFVQADGTVKAVNFAVSEATSNGVLVMGKFQLIRGNWTEHQACEIDVIGSTNTFAYYIIPTYDGKTMQAAVPGFLLDRSPKMRTYQKMVSGVNFSSLLIGQFNVTSMLISLTVGGST